jgi:hypothetical protein
MIKAALLLGCLMVGHGLSQATQDAGPPSDSNEALQNVLQNGQITLDISALAPSDDRVWIEIQTAGLPLGTVILVSRVSSRPESDPGTAWQQSLTAFGARSDTATQSYQLAVPRGADDTALSLQVQIGQADGGALRAATPSEVTRVTLLPPPQ